MSTYKLIQDIEAEDHIIGPLTLRQFIFALLAAMFFYFCFLAVSKKIEFLLVIFLPPGLFFGFFAIPFGRDQPTEVWALAKLRFWFKPRKRIWDQSGVKELVTVTAPKKVERVMTNGLNAYEVKSRLRALSTTLDSRGWAVKNASEPPLNQSGVNYTDRLIDMGQMPKPVPDETTDVDMLDETNSPVAQHFEQMIDESNQAHRQQLLTLMSSDDTYTKPKPSSNQWFIGSSSSVNNVASNQQVVEDNSDAIEEKAIATRLKQLRNAQHIPYSNLRTLNPPGEPKGVSVSPHDKTETSNSQKTPPDPAILSLANNDDLTVATLARQAHRANGDEPGEDEVVIALH